MLFNTYTFAVFLLIVFGAYCVLPLRGRQVMLLAASYVFYCWAKPVYGLLLLVSTCLDFTCGRAMAHVERRPARRWILLASVVGNLGLLSFFKYGDFIGENVAVLRGLFQAGVEWKSMGFILPVGISFYTFQTMSYTIQVYRRQIEPTRDLVSFALYVSFFPQLVAGPIERASNLLPQLQAYHRVTLDNIRLGLQRIIIGLFCKLVIADRLGILVDMFYENPDAFSTASAWVVMPAFIVQIYMDFAGYAHIAIGVARMFGIRLTENFRRPMLAASISDFWQRWHITLTSWLRDYVFVPLGGFRKGGARALLNGWIVLLLCGLWHGAAWHFVLWGAYQAMLVTGYYLWRYVKKKAGFPSSPLRARMGPRLLLFTLGTFTLSSFNTLFFRSPDVATIGHVVRALAGRHGGSHLATPWYVWAYLALVTAVMTVEFGQEHFALNARTRRLHWALRTIGFTLLALFTLLASVNSASPYIYFQF